MAEYGTELLPIFTGDRPGQDSSSRQDRRLVSSRLNAASSFASLVRLKENVFRSLYSSTSAVCLCQLTSSMVHSNMFPPLRPTKAPPFIDQRIFSALPKWRLKTRTWTLSNLKRNTA